MDYCTPDILILLKKAIDGDKCAEEEFISINIGLVRAVAKKFYNRGTDPEDILQLGMMGLVKAIHKFDFSYGVQFSTYAVPMIAGEIKRFLRDDGIIKVSRSTKEIAYKAKLLSEQVEKETGEKMPISKIAEELGISKEDLVFALSASESPESLNNFSSEDESYTLIDRLDNKSVQTEDTIVDMLTLKEMIRVLEPRERQIIILRYFKGKTQQNIADMLGISQVQVSRIEKKVLKNMREKFSIG